MKRVFLALAVIGMIGFTSCNKEKTCKCTYEFMGTTVESEEFTVEDGDCEEGFDDSTLNGIDFSCEEV